jgi:radical SAM protein with 4Fe4S-binding SPASM domain
VWELTARCNLSCIHCASDLGPATLRGEELSPGRALELCDELAALGCEYTVLSGGEPFLRTDWSSIAARLVARGVRVGMISNGLVVDEETTREMARVGVAVLAISLDGPAAIHDRIRRRAGSFDAALAALAAGRHAGLRLHAVTHVNRLNVDALDELLEIVQASGVSTWLVQLSAPWGRLRRHPEVVLAPAELPRVARWMAGARERARLQLAVGDNVGYYGELEPRLRRRGAADPLPFWCGCSAGCFTVGIEANGNVKGCLSLQSQDFVEGNLRSRTLREIWDDPRSFRYTRGFEPASLAGACQGCEYGEVCRGGCTFMAVGATGRPGDNPYCLHGLSSRA